MAEPLGDISGLLELYFPAEVAARPAESSFLDRIFPAPEEQALSENIPFDPDSFEAAKGAEEFDSTMRRFDQILADYVPPEGFRPKFEISPKQIESRREARQALAFERAKTGEAKPEFVPFTAEAPGEALHVMRAPYGLITSEQARGELFARHEEEALSLNEPLPRKSLLKAIARSLISPLSETALETAGELVPAIRPQARKAAQAVGEVMGAALGTPSAVIRGTIAEGLRRQKDPVLRRVDRLASFFAPEIVALFSLSGGGEEALNLWKRALGARHLPPPVDGAQLKRELGLAGAFPDSSDRGMVLNFALDNPFEVLQAGQILIGVAKNAPAILRAARLKAGIFLEELAGLADDLKSGKDPGVYISRTRFAREGGAITLPGEPEPPLPPVEPAKPATEPVKPAEDPVPQVAVVKRIEPVTAESKPVTSSGDVKMTEIGTVAKIEEVQPATEALPAAGEVAKRPKPRRAKPAATAIQDFRPSAIQKVFPEAFPAKEPVVEPRPGEVVSVPSAAEETASAKIAKFEPPPKEEPPFSLSPQQEAVKQERMAAYYKRGEISNALQHLANDEEISAELNELDTMIAHENAMPMPAVARLVSGVMRYFAEPIRGFVGSMLDTGVRWTKTVASGVGVPVVKEVEGAMTRAERRGIVDFLLSQRGELQNRLVSVRTIARQIGTFKPEDRMIVSQMIDGQLSDAFSRRTFPALHSVATRAIRAYMELGEELVDWGLITRATLEKRMGVYLPRLYEKHVNQLENAVGSILAPPPPALKQEMSRFMPRDETLNAGTREAMGEILDAGRIVGPTLAQEHVAVTKAKVQRFFAEGWSTDDPAEALKRGWKPIDRKAEKKLAAHLVEIEEAGEAEATEKLAIEGTRLGEAAKATKKSPLGPLEGKFVHPEIFEMLDPKTGWLVHEPPANEWLRLYKKGKTVWNPSAQVANGLSNFFFADAAGAPLYTPKGFLILVDSILDYAEHGKFTKIGNQLGLLGGDYVSVNVIKDELRAMAGITRKVKEPATALHAIFERIQGYKIAGAPARWAGKTDEFLQTLYQATDQVSKIATYKYLTEVRGFSPQLAKLRILKFMQHYNRLPPFLQRFQRGKVLQYGMTPFMAFQVEAMRTMGNAVTDPLALWAMAKWWGASAAFGVLATEGLPGIIDPVLSKEDLKELDAQRSAANDWMNVPYMRLVTPFTVKGQAYYIDMNRMFPWQRNMDAIAHARGAVDSLLHNQRSLKDSLTGLSEQTGIMNHPLIGSVLTLSGIDPRTKHQLVPKGTGYVEGSFRILSRLIEELAPPMTPGFGTYWNDLEAVAFRHGSPKSSSVFGVVSGSPQRKIRHLMAEITRAMIGVPFEAITPTTERGKHTTILTEAYRRGSEEARRERNQLIAVIEEQFGRSAAEKLDSMFEWDKFKEDRYATLAAYNAAVNDDDIERQKRILNASIKEGLFETTKEKKAEDLFLDLYETWLKPDAKKFFENVPDDILKIIFSTDLVQHPENVLEMTDAVMKIHKKELEQSVPTVPLR